MTIGNVRGQRVRIREGTTTAMLIHGTVGASKDATMVSDVLSQQSLCWQEFIALGTAKLVSCLKE